MSSNSIEATNDAVPMLKAGTATVIGLNSGNPKFAAISTDPLVKPFKSRSNHDTRGLFVKFRPDGAVDHYKCDLCGFVSFVTYQTSSILQHTRSLMHQHALNQLSKKKNKIHDLPSGKVLEPSMTISESDIASSLNDCGLVRSNQSINSMVDSHIASSLNDCGLVRSNQSINSMVIPKRCKRQILLADPSNDPLMQPWSPPSIDNLVDTKGLYVKRKCDGSIDYFTCTLCDYIGSQDSSCLITHAKTMKHICKTIQHHNSLNRPSTSHSSLGHLVEPASVILPGRNSSGDNSGSSEIEQSCTLKKNETKSLLLPWCPASIADNRGLFIKRKPDGNIDYYTCTLCGFMGDKPACLWTHSNTREHKNALARVHSSGASMGKLSALVSNDIPPCDVKEIDIHSETDANKKPYCFKASCIASAAAPTYPVTTQNTNICGEKVLVKSANQSASLNSFGNGNGVEFSQSTPFVPGHCGGEVSLRKASAKINIGNETTKTVANASTYIQKDFKMNHATVNNSVYAVSRTGSANTILNFADTSENDPEIKTDVHGLNRIPSTNGSNKDRIIRNEEYVNSCEIECNIGIVSGGKIFGTVSIRNPGLNETCYEEHRAMTLKYKCPINYNVFCNQKKIADETVMNVDNANNVSSSVPLRKRLKATSN